MTQNHSWSLKVTRLIESVTSSEGGVHSCVWRRLQDPRKDKRGDPIFSGPSSITVSIKWNTSRFCFTHWVHYLCQNRRWKGNQSSKCHARRSEPSGKRYRPRPQMAYRMTSSFVHVLTPSLIHHPAPLCAHQQLLHSDYQLLNYSDFH